jgi:hypothetical protein
MNSVVILTNDLTDKKSGVDWVPVPVRYELCLIWRIFMFHTQIYPDLRLEIRQRMDSLPHILLLRV